MHRILNTIEVCRLLNGRDKEDFEYCYVGEPFGANRVAPRFNAGQCNNQKNECDPKYRTVWTQLGRMEEKGYLFSCKMRFYDKGHKALATDEFRFWFLDKKEFQEKILRQTLIPYVA